MMPGSDCDSERDMSTRPAMADSADRMSWLELAKALLLFMLLRFLLPQRFLLPDQVGVQRHLPRRRPPQRTHREGAGHHAYHQQGAREDDHGDAQRLDHVALDRGPEYQPESLRERGRGRRRHDSGKHACMCWIRRRQAP